MNWSNWFPEIHIFILKIGFQFCRKFSMTRLLTDTRHRSHIGINANIWSIKANIHIYIYNTNAKPPGQSYPLQIISTTVTHQPQLHKITTLIINKERHTTIYTGNGTRTHILGRHCPKITTELKTEHIHRYQWLDAFTIYQ